MPDRDAQPPGESVSPHRDTRRRATILIFTIGVLTLLALVGVGLLASVRTQRNRVIVNRAAVTPSKLVDSVVQTVQQRLRDDLWDGSDFLGGSTTAAPTDARERSEPFDAPGPFDRWLASTVPYRVDPNPDPLVAGDDFLVWHRVSYLGADLLRDDGLYNWPDNSRTPAVGDPTTFNVAATNDAKLTDVPIGPVVNPVPGLVLIDPPVDYGPGLYPYGALPAPPSAQPTNLPGSTTNVPIELARRVQWQTLPAAWRDTHRFPYFDTNQDGIIDLYDADGDGVPDSPISFILSFAGNRPDEPRDVYVVVRIVDNSSMINLSTATARDSDGDFNGDGTDPGDIFQPVFSAFPDQQFRGRRPWEVCVDAVKFVTPGLADASAALDADIGPPVQAMLGYRFTGNAMSAPSPSDGFQDNVLRRLLVGGAWRSSDSFGLFRAADELAIRGRNTLAGYMGGGSGARTTVEQSLPASLPMPGAPGYRWVRYAPASAYGPIGSGWIARLDTETIDRDAAFGAGAWPANRRPVLTTLSRVSDRFVAPEVVRPAGLGVPPQVLGLTSIGIPIPVEPMRVYYDVALPSGEQVLPEKIDLNAAFVLDPYTPAPGAAIRRSLVEGDAISRAIYLGHLMWAFQNAGRQPSPGNFDGPQVYTDPVDDNADGVPEPVVPRHELAAQLAANVMDFRDSDHVPTVVEGGPLSTPVAGLEVQPFITEVYAKCVITNDGSPNGSTLGSLYAVEVWNPYNVPMNGYKLRVEGAPGNPTIDVVGIPPGERRVLLSTDVGTFAATTGIPLLAGLVQDDSVIAGTQAVINQIVENNSGQMLPRRIYLIRSDINLHASGAPVNAPWVCDAFIMNRPEAVDGAWSPAIMPPILNDVAIERNFFQRDDSDGSPGVRISWKFTIGRSKRSNNPASDSVGQTLGQPNDAVLSDVVASVWTFRNLGLQAAFPPCPPSTTRAFESPADLSRILAFGNDYFDLNNAAATIPSEPVTVPEKLAYFQHRVNTSGIAPGARITAGRLDFADLLNPPANNKPETGRLLHYLTCSGHQFDCIDNDGDIAPDEVGESLSVAFRQAGLINVNTAPAVVLRAVPWMTRVDDNADPAIAALRSWDFAPAIVAQRENRPVRSVFETYSALGPAFAPVSAPALAGRPYVTIGDLLRVSSAATQFDLARFATPLLTPPPDNSVGANYDYSPDFDRIADGAAEAAAEVRARDLFLARWGNLLTTRSDVFTVYVALLDENGRYLRRSRFVIDRTNTAAEDVSGRRPQMPTVTARTDTDYYDDTR